MQETVSSLDLKMHFSSMPDTENVASENNAIRFLINLHIFSSANIQNSAEVYNKRGYKYLTT